MKTGLAAMLVFLGTFAGAIAVGVTPAGASTLNGVATIANPVSNAPLVSGWSASNFTVTLPAVSGKPAHCTGASNSRTDSYHVFSYMVKKGISPTSVSFRTGYPSTGLGYFTSSGEYYGKANTAATTGQIIDIPNNLDFAELLAKHVTLATLLYTAAKAESGRRVSPAPIRPGR